MALFETVLFHKDGPGSFVVALAAKEQLSRRQPNWSPDGSG